MRYRNSFSIVLVGAAMFLAFMVGRRSVESYSGLSPGAGGWLADTVIVREVVRDTVPVPVVRRVVRIDTVFVATIPNAESGVAGSCKTDSLGGIDSARVVLPIERRVYSTADYRAVIEGFRPSLTEIEVYRTTASITRIRSPGWGVGVQAGLGFTSRGMAPYVGVGVHYRLWGW